MKPHKHFRAMAISVMVLGSIHICAFPFIAGTAKNPAFSYMFIMTGVATCFIGWLQFTIIKNLPINYLDMKILKASVVFVGILGAGAVATMWNNPFAYISLLIALYEIYLIKKLNEIVA